MKNNTVKNNIKTDTGLDYETDPRFIAYMKSRLEAVTKDREQGKLISSNTVFSNIRDRYGW